MFSFLKSSPNISTDSFNKLVDNKTRSDNFISLNPIKNLPPFSCRYFENLSSRRSVWSLDVKTNFYYKGPPWDKQCNLVLNSAEHVCLVRVNFCQFWPCKACHLSNQSANARKNKGLLPPSTAASPIRKSVLHLCLISTINL